MMCQPHNTKKNYGFNTWSPNRRLNVRPYDVHISSIILTCVQQAAEYERQQTCMFLYCVLKVYMLFARICFQ